MEIPSIGTWITSDMAIDLAIHFNLLDVVERIQENPADFKGWEFDGASAVPDHIASLFLGIPNLIEIALRHDLKYAYGVPGDDEAKLKADWEFGLELLADGASAGIAHAAVNAVELFGKLPTDFGWGFARIEV